MKKSLLLVVAIILHASLFAQTPGVSVFDTSGKEYIEYIPGNLPIIISAPHGGLKLTGGTVNGVNYPDNSTTNNSSQPYYLPTRGCGTNERDDNTDVLIERIQAELFAQTGGYAHVIINRLNRKKLDPNREQNEATCGNANALFFWNAWHSFLDDASTAVETNWGKGLYIDLHGQSHSIPRIEVGYNVTSSQLNSASGINGASIVNNSTIKNLVANNLNGLNHEQLVRGDDSLGELFQNAAYHATSGFYAAQNYPGCTRNGTTGYRAIPSSSDYGSSSCDDTQPFSNAYFDGDFYNNRRHGSGQSASDGLGGGGTVDGIMTEVNRRVRDLGSPFSSGPDTTTPFAKDYASVVLEYIDTHYNDFTGFGYSSASYDAGTDSNPTPTLSTGVSGGLYTSSPVGLVIDSNTGTIDLMGSTPGNYTVTYSVGPSSVASAPNRYYSSSQTVEIIASTLSVVDFNKETFKLYPNPANEFVQFESNKEISKVVIFNLLGQEMISIKTNARQATLDVSNLTQGSYLMSFYIEGLLVNSKVILKN
ncbi:T9SS type A sorting domain-containing protein [uncultured Lacinutrix sp.]|uniref:T9SS type A sorting domain-containing protein n=1 Tax=uncultured Lacinutrix sp. TaxID=574032 RepID=UPI0026157313|nr:T9SS type A sorting domain-containing protein [uncultured Lacinutrix sp.]